jgi:hypothetical protein
MEDTVRQGTSTNLKSKESGRTDKTSIVCLGILDIDGL